MLTWKLDDKGDISFDKLGKSIWIDGKDKKIQSIQMRLNTKLNTLFYDEEYGFKPIRGKKTKEIVMAYINEALIKDKDINAIDFISLENINGNWIADVDIYLIDEYNSINIKLAI